MPPEVKFPLFSQIIPVAESSLVTGKVLVILEDICFDCGVRYMVRVLEQVGNIKFKPGQPPTR